MADMKIHYSTEPGSQTTAAGATITFVPNKPKTPLRNIRVDDDLWQAAQAAAEVRGETVSEAIRKFLKRYAKSTDKRGWHVGDILDGSK